MTRCRGEVRSTIAKSVAKQSCNEEFQAEVAEKSRHMRAKRPTEPKMLIFKISGRAASGQRVMGISILSHFGMIHFLKSPTKPKYGKYHTNLTIILKNKGTREATNSSDSSGD